MLRDGGLGQGEAVGDIGAAALALLLGCENAQNFQPDRVAQGPHDIGNVVVMHGAALNSLITVPPGSKALDSG
ncbi:hypothetical protein D9M68_922070 [compost metagenome]